AEGRFFDADAVKSYAQDAVIDQNAVNTLFAGFQGSPVGQVILVGSTPARVVGVAAPSSGFGGGRDTVTVYLPYTTVQARMLGDNTLRTVTVRVKDETPSAVAEAGVTKLLTQRHGTKDFFIVNTDEIRQTITSTTQTMTIL